MAVRVLLFSVLREKLGRRSVEIEVEGETTSGALLDELAGAYPAVRPYYSSLRVAVNQTYVGLDHPVQSGDEVAVITPVSGG